LQRKKKKTNPDQIRVFGGKERSMTLTEMKAAIKKIPYNPGKKIGRKKLVRRVLRVLCRKGEDYKENERLQLPLLKKIEGDMDPKKVGKSQTWATI